jgi:hypothetical protein
MKRQWKTIWVKATIWLVTEILLNLLGLDNLADYSEFLFEKEVAICASQQRFAIATSQPQMAVVVPPCPPQFNYNLPYRFTVGFNA